MSVDYSGLNLAQREAVYSDHDRICCLAGAGSGKTRVLTHRMALLYENGVSTNNMLALTFTRAAGAQMKERVIGLIGNDGMKLFCNTFHAFCVDVIRENAKALGYTPDLSVYSQAECEELLEEVLADGRYKITPKRLTGLRAGKTDGLTAIELKQAERAVKEYEFRLKRSNAIDFDGLIYTVRRALTDFPGIHETLWARYKYVFIDEFQDTDPAQWEIVNLLNPANLFVVGDDFQSIYGFRGSDIGVILSLAKDPAWLTVKLEENYRSTLPIVAAANNLIRYNSQTEKKLITEKTGACVDYRTPVDDDAEITDIISRLIANQTPERQKTTAILARTNRQLACAQKILSLRGVPCEISGSTDSPFDGSGARILLAWISAAWNVMDDAAMRRIAGTMMNKPSILEAERMQLEESVSFADALSKTDWGAVFLDIYDKHCNDFYLDLDADMASSVERLAHNLNIYAPKALNFIRNWQTRQSELGESADVTSLLSYIRLTDIVSSVPKERGADKTYLMTVHGSKGLEFDEVFIIGAVQGVFPGKGDLAEERRLFYVAMTRAREYLNISAPRAVSDWSGNKTETIPSRFINEARISPTTEE